MALKVKTYRVFAAVFTLAGIALVLVLYMTKAEGDPLVFFKNPLSIVYVLFPFVPALIFSKISTGAEKQLQKMMGDPADKKPTDKKDADKKQASPAADAKKEPAKDAPKEAEKDAKEPQKEVKKEAKETKK